MTNNTSSFVPSQWVSQAQFSSLRLHPALPQAVAHFAGFLIETYTNSPLLKLLLSDRGRLLLGFFVLYLDVLPLPGTQGIGATLSGVQSLCRSTGTCSAGRAASMLTLMRFSSYVTQARDVNDTRRRILVPTLRLTGAYNRNWAAQFQAMSLVFPDAVSVPAWLEQPAYRTAFLRALGTLFLGGFRVIEHVPVLQHISESQAALMILTELALPQITGSRKPGEVAPLSVSAVARRFGVSRAHVRSILNVASTAALIVRKPDLDGVIVQPSLSEAVLQLYAVLFFLYDRCATMACNEIRSNQ